MSPSLCPLDLQPRSPPPAPILFSASAGLAISASSAKWNQTPFPFSASVLLTRQNVLRVHPRCHSGTIAFLPVAERRCRGCRDRVLFIHSSAGVFTARCACEESAKSPLRSCFQFGGVTPGSGAAGSSGSSVFHLWRKLRAVLPSGCTVSDSHPQDTEFPSVRIFADMCSDTALMELPGA